MSGYLEQYGAGEDRKENLVRNTVVLGLGGILVAALGFYVLHPYHQISVTKRFLARLQAKDYPGGYEAWGCGQQKPCKEYAYGKFLEDWGPKSPSGLNPTLRISDSENCGTGVIVTVNVSPGNFQPLFVDKGSDALSFSPVPVCPAKSPWAIMAHRTIGRMRRILF